MIGFAALAGFNKGVGGGGYGPVVTIGGLIAGVPVKSMLAVTAICEGTVSGFSIIVWLALLSSGVQIDYLLLPSFMIATMFSAIAAPYMTRVFPEKAWRSWSPPTVWWWRRSASGRSSRASWPSWPRLIVSE